MRKWSDELLEYFSKLTPPDLPKGVECLNPYASPIVMDYIKQFVHRFYNDTSPRQLLLGINPGRFGSGVTGISFTDPIRLQENLGIANELNKRGELSSEFIYEVIEAFGGPTVFYRNFLVSAVYPLGFVKDGRNINYYEIPEREEMIMPSIYAELEKHVNWNLEKRACVSIGKGENVKFLNRWNQDRGHFNEMLDLPHPRWIMQYRRKEKDRYVDQYLQLLHGLVEQK